MPMSEAFQQVLSSFEQSVLDQSFVALVLRQHVGATEDLKSVHIRKILVKREEKLSFTYRYKTRDIVKNYSLSESISVLRPFLASDFHEAALSTTECELLAKQGKPLKRTAPKHTETPSLTHDRDKKRWIAPEAPYLHALNITDKSGQVLHSAQAKFRQINKFVEILSGLVARLPAQPRIQVADMGCGKGYLTFALYDYLVSQGLPARVCGVEARQELVDLCNGIAKSSGFDGLSFVQGTIESYDAAGTTILIALHACDTATDEAIYQGITTGAETIVVAPCCHKQIRKQMQKHPPALEFLLKHGIFEEREAEMVTDGLRAMILEYYGYDTQVFEFISDAHTPKNVMIAATKRPNATRDPKLLEKIRNTKSYFGIGYHHLERMLKLENV